MWLPSELVQCASTAQYGEPWKACGGLVETSLQPSKNHHSSNMRVEATGQSELAKADDEIREGSENARTTVMLRNLPNHYTRAMLTDLLETEGFGDIYDFLYLPIDFRTQAALGYAFVNLLDSDIVQRFWSYFDGFTNWALPSKKSSFVSWCEPHQGLQAHIERYRNSPVMHKSVPDKYKPVLMKHGQRIKFPKPTKIIRAPRTRNCPQESRRVR